MPEPLPKLYGVLAEWFSLLSPPEDYAAESHRYREIIERHFAGKRAETMLELGCGGGHNASHLKARFRMTLTDLSPAMLDLSRLRNPECEHLPGDMRSLRLGRLFDVVLIHDAVSYMTNQADLAAALDTAFVHCAPGGVALFCPDYVHENFAAGTAHGGSDGQGRALRYLEWTWDPDPDDHQYQVDFAYLLQTGGEIRVESDRHILGLFSQDEWKQRICEAGFESRWEPFEHADAAAGSVVFVGFKPAGESGTMHRCVRR
jgi:SAM-dependent methyltransferase